MAGLGTALCWGCAATIWAISGRYVGAIAVACIRATLSTLILLVVHLVLWGSPFPLDIPEKVFWLLALSGVLGLGISDLLFFRALVLIGPRIAMTILSLMPFMCAAIAYFTPPQEGLGPWALVGMVVTVGGVLLVVTERRERMGWKVQPGHYKLGVLFALVATVLIAVGFVLSKLAFEIGGPTIRAFPATLVRVASGAVVLWIAVPMLGLLGATARALRHRRAMGLVVLGSIIGPVFGIWLSLVSIKLIPETGVATTLISTSPIMMILIARVVYGEKATLRTVIGTLLAVTGVAVLMLRDMFPG